MHFCDNQHPIKGDAGCEKVITRIPEKWLLLT